MSTQERAPAALRCALCEAEVTPAALARVGRAMDERRVPLWLLGVHVLCIVCLAVQGFNLGWAWHRGDSGYVVGEGLLMLVTLTLIVLTLRLLWRRACAGA